MLPLQNLILNSLSSSSRVEDIGSHVVSANQNSRINENNIGSVFTAEIVKKISNDQYFVNVAGSSFVMKFPTEVDIGQKINLQLNQVFPEFVFALNGQTKNLSNENPNLPQSLTLPNISGVIDKIGSDAKTISQNSHRLFDHDSLPQIASMSEPLIADEIKSNTIAMALRSAVSKTGLFYESHVKNWIEGTLPLKDLLIEAKSISMNDSVIPKTVPSFSHENLGAWLGSEQSRVATQLAILEKEQIKIELPAWKDQQASLHIERRNGRSHDDKMMDGDENWETSLSLDMPGLGKVIAKIKILDSHLHISVNAESTEAQQTLQAAKTLLVSSMDANGCMPSSLTVGRAHE